MGDGGESGESPYLTLILKLLSAGTAAGDLFFTPNSRWRAVTAYLLFVMSYHRAIDSC